jgi:hypothetical protein
MQLLFRFFCPQAEHIYDLGLLGYSAGVKEKEKSQGE